MNENDDGFDIDIQDDLDQEIGQEAVSLKEVWRTSPLLKAVAVFIGGAVLVGAYVTLTAPDPVEEAKSVMRGPDTQGVKVTPGQEELDEAYVEAIQESNQQRAEYAMKTGTSSIDTPTPSENTGISIPQAPTTGLDRDPLQEWRNKVEAKKMVSGEREGQEEEFSMPEPEVVPMVQPIRPQQAVQMDPQAAANMAAQMRTVIATQAPPGSSSISVTSVDSAYVREKKQADAEKKKQGADAKTAPVTYDKAGRQVYDDKVIVPAGQIAYAQLLTELNSDVPGPALAVIMSGPFRGGRALGAMSTKDDYIVVTFNRIVKDGVSYSVNGIALDEKTTLPAQRTSINNHYIKRIILPAAATFLQGFAASVAETGTSSTTTTGGGVVSDQPEPETKESMYAGLEQAAGTVSGVLQEDANVQPTIRIAKGTTMGVLFLDPIKTSSVE